MTTIKATLSSNKESVNFNFGGHLDNWQIQSICINRSDEEIRKYLKEKREDGWYDEAIEEFIDFKNSELINEMIF